MDLQKRLDFISETKKKVFEVSEEAAKKLQSKAKSKSQSQSDNNKNNKSETKTAAARMNMLFDEGTFVEINAFVKKRPTELTVLTVLTATNAASTTDNIINNDEGEYEGVVTGYGAVDGQLVFAYAQDFSRKSGALSEAGVKKILNVYSMAEKNGAPVVSVFDSSGVIVTEGIDALAGYGAVINKAAALSGVVPQYSAICGTCAGGASVIASASDFIFIEKNNGQIFINSPFVIKNKAENSGENINNNIGSAEFAAKNGQCAKIIEGEDNVFASLRSLIEYIPSNNLDNIVYMNSDDDINRINDNLADLVLTEKYDMKQVITEIADNNKFFELYEDYAKNIVCGFISLANTSVGVVANQPKEYNGAVCPGVCDKAARFIYVCDSFNIPVLTLVDTEGTVVSQRAENSPFGLYAAKLASAYASASIPKITLNIGKAYGTAYMIMGSKGLGADIVMAYPTAQISILPPETAVEILYGDDISKSSDPASERANLVSMWEVEKSSPTEAAAGGSIDSIIEPKQTRQMIASAIYLLQSKREIRPPKKHNKLPL